MNDESPRDPFSAGAEGEGAAPSEAHEGEDAEHESPRPEPRIPYARAHAPGATPSKRKGTIPGAASAPPPGPASTEESYHGPIPAPAPLPRVPGVDRFVGRSGADGAEAADPGAAASHGEAAEGAARRRSRRLVKLTEDTAPTPALPPVVEVPPAPPPAGEVAPAPPPAVEVAPTPAPPAVVEVEPTLAALPADVAIAALAIPTPAAISGPSPEVRDDDWTTPEPAATEAEPPPQATAWGPSPTPEAPAAELAPTPTPEPAATQPAGEAPASAEHRPAQSDKPSPLARSSVPRPAPRPVSVRTPSASGSSPAPAAIIPPVALPPPDLYIADPDSVAVIRPIQIIAVESDLPPVTSAPEIEVSSLYLDEHDETALPLRFVSDGPTPIDPRAELGDIEALSMPDDGPPTARDEQREPRPKASSSPDLSLWAGAGWATPAPPPPEEVDDEEVQSRPSVDEIEAEPLEEVEPEPRSGDVDAEPIELEPERDSDAGEEIPVLVDEPESQPKKPPPPPPRRVRPPAPASPDLPPYSSPVPPPAETPRVASTQPQPGAAAQPQPAATTQPQPGAAAQPQPAITQPQPVAITQPQPAARPLAEPAGPLSDNSKRKKPWWEELFGDDFIRTLDKLEPKVVRHEVDFIEERLGVEKNAVILDLACGAGVHAVEMASRGYSVVGYDLSLAMLARAADEAQERHQKLNFLQGDMREMAFEETFDAVYCWSTSFGYFDEEKNADVLQRVRRALRAGGLLLLDMINRDYVAGRQPSLVWFEGDGCVCMDEMQVDFFTSRLKVKRTVMFEDGRSRELDYSIRLYGLHELGKLLHEAGFKVTEVTGHPAHPGVFFGSESPRIIILAERS